MKFNTIRFKISVLYVVILGAILIFLSASLFYSAKYILYRNLDRDLMNKAKEVTEIINAYVSFLGATRQSVITASRRVIRFENLPDPEKEKLDPIDKRLYQMLEKYALSRDFFNLTDAEGVTIARSKAHVTATVKRLLHSQKARLTEDTFKGPYLFTDGDSRILKIPIRLRDQKPYTLQIATSEREIKHLLDDWLIWILGTLVAIMCIAGFIGSLFAKQILRPIQEVTLTAEKISHEDLSHRVQEGKFDEEMKYLVRAFNDMIGRLQISFQHIQNFSAHVAHELKTPLAIIRGESEVALRKERAGQDYKQVIETNLKETERMIKIVEDLLLLAKLDYDTAIFQFKKFDFITFMQTLKEQGEILGTSRKVRVDLHSMDPKLEITGDEYHLKRLFLNILDNAIKFSPPESRIDIDIRKNESAIAIAIRDQGCGIEEADLTRIFDPFFHQSSQHDETSGNGLGLSIALSIAKAHRGDIKVISVPKKGSTFTIELPLSASL